MSPVQFQKLLRLQKARQLMVVQNMSAGSAKMRGAACIRTTGGVKENFGRRIITPGVVHRSSAGGGGVQGGSCAAEHRPLKSTASH